MANQASTGDLEALHRLVAQSLSKRLQQDMDDAVPTDAATLGAAIKFLKDNSISADPSDSDDLQELREKLREQALVRAKHKRQQGENIVSLAGDELESMQG